MELPSDARASSTVDRINNLYVLLEYGFVVFLFGSTITMDSACFNVVSRHPTSSVPPCNCITNNFRTLSCIWELGSYGSLPWTYSSEKDP